MKKSYIMVTLIVGISFLLLGCQSKKEIVIASKPMTEQYIISQVLIELIETETDLEVEYKSGVGGGTSNIHPAMVKGDIDIYPEYTGTGWLQVLKKDNISDPDELYQAVKQEYSEEYNIKWMGLYGFNNTYGIAMKQDLAEELGIQTYSDLADKGSHLKFGAEYDFYEREDGFPGLQETYGIDFDDKSEIDIGLKYEAIANDEVDVINVFSTDGRLAEHDLVVLEDDLNFFPSYYATTLVREETLEEYPELEPILERLTNTLNNDDITYMNYLVEVKNEDPKQVAKDFIKEKGLLN
ncbi:glycine betaine ABC transporter substrate-binding protein [Haloplasma contractile]|uniref:Glycine betaine transport system permease protein n=1 Tax=Haloplasma contractile SSD-17B TaxID=1033810 RepID=F7PVH6_9MOLU|nr:glycine betaine ABC transporter substrate-binding protein [Haloplasma contractile]ERJ12856.1 Glycine betaine transport system permease protein [Haloplasma contractile SSD-17B]